MKHALLLAGVAVVGFVLLRKHSVALAGTGTAGAAAPSVRYSGGVDGTASPSLMAAPGASCSTCADSSGALSGNDKMQALPVRIDSPAALDGEVGHAVFYAHSPLHYSGYLQ